MEKYHQRSSVLYSKDRTALLTQIRNKLDLVTAPGLGRPSLNLSPRNNYVDLRHNDGMEKATKAYASARRRSKETLLYNF